MHDAMKERGGFMAFDRVNLTQIAKIVVSFFISDIKDSGI